MRRVCVDPLVPYSRRPPVGLRRQQCITPLAPVKPRRARWGLRLTTPQVLVSYYYNMKNIKNIVVHSIKFPEGEFTHTELARFNGVSNQTVWQRYLRARQTGQIISAGTRKVEKSKGTPSLLWRVNPNFTMALMVVPQPSMVTPVAVVANADEHAELQNELAAELASA